MSGKPTVPVAMPPLLLQLENALKKKGAPLTEKEVLDLRDRAPCIQMEVADAQLLAESRGADLDLNNPWPAWSVHQQKLVDKHD